MTFDTDGSLVETTVVKTFQREVDSWIRLKVNGTTYYVTEEHPFFTNKGLVQAQDLQVGDMVLTSKAMNGFEVQSVKRIDRLKCPPSIRPKPLKVYNIQCSPYNSYLVDYMWVHNCDTPQALNHKEGGSHMTIDEIAEKVKTLNIILTGGEPLEQKGIGQLLERFKEDKHITQVETGGHMPPIGRPDEDLAHWVVDFKCPSSRMTHRMPPLEKFMLWWKDYQYIVKLVVNLEDDADFAIQTMLDMVRLGYQEMFLVSPLDGNGKIISSLADKIRKANPSLLDLVIFSVQIHKQINLP